MRILWRALPTMVLAGAIGLGLAYVATGFLPRPQPSLRPPEELRARGVGYGEESPARAIFERNVLHLEQPPFNLPGSPLLPPAEPVPDRAALSRPTLPEDFSQSLAGKEAANKDGSAAAPAASAAPGPIMQSLEGGFSVLGRVSRPPAAAQQTDAPQNAPQAAPANAKKPTKPTAKPTDQPADQPAGKPAGKQ